MLLDPAMEAADLELVHGDAAITDENMGEVQAAILRILDRKKLRQNMMMADAADGPRTHGPNTPTAPSAASTGRTKAARLAANAKKNPKEKERPETKAAAKRKPKAASKAKPKAAARKPKAKARATPPNGPATQKLG